MPAPRLVASSKALDLLDSTFQGTKYVTKTFQAACTRVLRFIRYTTSPIFLAFTLQSLLTVYESDTIGQSLVLSVI